LDKNPAIRTVINKTEDVGTESVFRTFPYEVLAGPADLDVTISSNGCEFKFNFGKVYWNTRLEFEHERLIGKFREGETVCDVMAGVGPFAMPSGKKRVFVWANDLNPDSYEGLSWAIKRNKVDQFVHASCSDGRDFIRSATKKLPTAKRRAVLKPKSSRTGPKAESAQVERIIDEPASFDHYVMNLPASAVEFLDAFRGTYVGREREFQPHTERKLPMIHVYCFVTKRDVEAEEDEAVCALVSKHLGHPVTLDLPDVEVWYVRLVSPKKKMFCASFRLPPEVAFAEYNKQAAAT
jgi:tRNA (guanine37-N1)-methyltransferase